MVLAHGAAIDTVRRHLPIWREFHDRVIICSPADDPVQLPDVWGFVTGRSSRYAAETNVRTLRAMLLASELRPNFLTFCEYDALLWRWPEELVHSLAAKNGFEKGWVAASLFHNDDAKFKGSFYLHSPIIFSREAIPRVAVEMANLPRDAEHGFGDRYFGLAVENSGIPVMNGHDCGLSYSQNHIQRHHWEDAKNVISAGGCFSHGIKDTDTLRVLLAASRKSH